MFLGGQEFGLRSNADNFTIEEIKEGCEFFKIWKYLCNSEYYRMMKTLKEMNFLMALQDAGVHEYNRCGSIYYRKM